MPQWQLESHLLSICAPETPPSARYFRKATATVTGMTFSCRNVAELSFYSLKTLWYAEAVKQKSSGPRGNDIVPSAENESYSVKQMIFGFLQEVTQ